MFPAPLRDGSVLVGLFFALALVVPSGYSFGAMLLTAAGLTLGIGAVLRPRSPLFKRPSLGTNERIVLWVMALFFLSWLLEILLGDRIARGLDKPLRVVYAALALLALLRYPARPVFFWGGLALGAILSGGLAMWQFFVPHMGRAEGFSNAIQFGNIALLLGMLCLSGVGWAADRAAWRGRWLGLLCSGFVCGLLASLLSGSRGGWVSVPFVLLLVLFNWRRQFSRRMLSGFAMVLLAALASTYLLSNNLVRSRFQSAYDEVSGYFQKKAVDTSVGLRLEMWKAGVLAVQDAPLLGHGKRGMWRYIETRTEQGDLHQAILHFRHLHNDYVDIAGRRGLIGLALLLALYLLPLWRFCSALGNTSTVQARPYALAGAVLCIAYFCYSLTQGFLTHNSGVMMFFFTLVICLSMMRQAMCENVQE